MSLHEVTNCIVEKICPWSCEQRRQVIVTQWHDSPSMNLGGDSQCYFSVSRPSLNHLFRGTIGDLISPRHVAGLHCMGTKTKRLPAGLWQPQVSPAVNLCRANKCIQPRQNGKRQVTKSAQTSNSKREDFTLSISFLFDFFSCIWQFGPSAVSVCLQCDDNTKYVHCKICCSGGNKQAEQAEFCASLL